VRLRLVVVLLALVAISAKEARADEPSAASIASPPPVKQRRDRPVLLALAAGFATAAIPLALGATGTADSTSDPVRNTGYEVSGAGLALAPIVSHIVLGEWSRAAAFGAVPVASEIGMVTLLSAKPGSIFHGTVGTRTLFGLIFSLDAFGSALGMVDVMVANDRASIPPVWRIFSSRNLSLAPVVTANYRGLSLGGKL
jgi:hypothetical protein